MKTILLIGSILFSCSILAQTEWTADMVKNATKNKTGIIEYTASDGSVWTVGNRITFGNPTGVGVFNSISMGDGMISVVQQVPASWSGSEAEIKKIRVSGTKRQGRLLWVTCKGPMQPFHLKIEKAIELGEVVTEGYSSDKALEELKRAKDKLDLGLITQEEFNILREELSKYIN